MRIDKFFSELGLLSRSECKKAVKAGHIQIGERRAKSSDEHIDPETDQVFYKGAPVAYSRHVYYMLNKPAGVVTANTDREHKTVFDLVGDKRPGLSAVGRLDLDTTGILIITNDGELNHRLLSSKYHVPKTYMVTADGNVSEDDLKKLSEGIDIGDEEPTLPANARIVETHDCKSIVELTIIEGRYHQVKRMFGTIGKPVLSLHRSSFGPITLDPDLKEGQIRPLNEAEIQALKAAGNLE